MLAFREVMNLAEKIAEKKPEMEPGSMKLIYAGKILAMDNKLSESSTLATLLENSSQRWVRTCGPSKRRQATNSASIFTKDVSRDPPFRVNYGAFI